MDLVLTSAERRPLAALLAANVVSVTGSAVTLMGVPWFVLQNTGSAADAGVVAFCAMLPVVLAALVAGPVVDRVGRRRVSIVSDLVCGLAVGAIPLLQSAGMLRFWMLCALMGVTGLFHAPGDTARGVLLPTLAQRAGVPLTRAAGFYDGASRCAATIGSAVGGVLIAVLGASHVLIVDASTFAVSAVLIASGLRDVPGSGPGGGRAGRAAGLPPGAGRGLPVRAGFSAAPGDLPGHHARPGPGPGLERGPPPGSRAGQPRRPGRPGPGGGPLLRWGTGRGTPYGTIGGRIRRWPLYAAAFLIVGAPRFTVAALTGTVAPLAAMMTIEGLACGVINPILATAIYQTVPDELRSRVLSAMTASALMIAPLGGLAAGFLAGSPA